VIVGIWVALVVVALPLAALQSSRLSGGGFEDTSSDSTKVQRAIDDGRFRGVQGSVLTVLLVPGNDAQRGDLRAAVGEVDERIRGLDEGIKLDAAGRRAALASARRDPDQRVVIPLDFRGGETAATDKAQLLWDELGIAPDHAGAAADGRVDVHVVGQGSLWVGFRDTTNKDVSEAEARGFPIIGLVLLLAFGSIAAAVLPLSLGAAAVVVTGAIIYLLSLVTEMSVFVTSMASMLGIGVAVDYALFILVRYREEIRVGASPGDARATALRTSGRAVIFSGLTVLTSLCALFLIPSSGIRSMAIGAIVVVGISVLATATLLPVLIGLLGRRAHEPGRVGRYLEARGRRRAKPPEQSFWARWTAAVMRRPRLSLIGATALVLVLIVPAFDLNVRNNASSQLDRDHESRVAIREATSVVQPGALAPTRILVELADGTAADASNRRTIQRLNQAIGDDPVVGRTDRPRPSEDGRSVLLTGIFLTDPESQASRDGVERLRERLSDVAGDRADVAVGGTTAVILDFDRLVTGALWKLMLFVFAASFVVMLVLLRSVVLPLKAMVMNALSIAASYGVLVAIFQWGWLSFLGIDKAPSIYPITLPLVLVVGFGLSMDYHVFLLSRIRERYEAHGDNRRAVAEALTSSATPITSAALIMVAVFLSFVSAGVPSVQQLGFAAAVAIALDATLVRLVIVPAAMELLGRWNWWLPGPLDRVLPSTASIEGEAAPPPPAPEPPRFSVDGSTELRPRVGAGADAER
jgi:RND superfamily putative drug exporter